jgi:hypothetical protein
MLNLYAPAIVPDNMRQYMPYVYAVRPGEPMPAKAGKHLGVIEGAYIEDEIREWLGDPDARVYIFSGPGLRRIEYALSPPDEQSLAGILAADVPKAAALRNVAQCVLALTEVKRQHNGKRRSRTYAGTH